MAYNEYLAERITQTLKEKKVLFDTRKMMGGLCFMVDDKMCIGINKDFLMARIDPLYYEIYLKEKGSRPMDFTGRPMKGFIFVEPEGTDLETDLEEWIDRCLEFNPKAKSSKKK